MLPAISLKVPASKGLKMHDGREALVAVLPLHALGLSKQSLVCTCQLPVLLKIIYSLVPRTRMPNGTAEVIDARELAPAAANETMYNGEGAL